MSLTALRLFRISSISGVMESALVPLVSARELGSGFLRAWAKAFRSALLAKAPPSQSVMAVVSCFCMCFCTRPAPDCMQPGLHLAASYKPGIAFRSLSDIERGHFPDHPMLLCRAEWRSESDKVRGLETIWIALPLPYLLINCANRLRGGPPQGSDSMSGIDFTQRPALNSGVMRKDNVLDRNCEEAVKLRPCASCDRGRSRKRSLRGRPQKQR